MSNPPTELLKRLLEASANSPLSEADPASLDELTQRIPTIWNKKPETPEYYSDTEVSDMMLYFRHKRAMFATLATQKEIEDATKPRRGRKTATTLSSADEGI